MKNRFKTQRSSWLLLGASSLISLCVQVALLGQAKSVQVQMDKLCEEADTGSKEGLHNLLTGQLDLIAALMKRLPTGFSKEIRSFLRFMH